MHAFRKIRMAFLITLFIFFSSVSKAQEYPLPSAGYTPESPFYRFEIFWDKLVTAFLFGNGTKAETYFRLADERLSEAYELSNKNTEGTERALGLYTEAVRRAHLYAQKSENQDLMLRAVSLVGRHFMYLDRISERMPVEKKAFAVLAKEYVIDDHTDTLRLLLEKNPKDALTDLMAAMEARLVRIEAVARDRENIEENLREYEKYAIFATKISALELVSNIDNLTVRGVAARETRSHLTRLPAVQPKIKPQALEQYLRSVNALRAVHGMTALKLEDMETDAPIELPGESVSDPTQDNRIPAPLPDVEDSTPPEEDGAGPPPPPPPPPAF